MRSLTKCGKQNGSTSSPSTSFLDFLSGREAGWACSLVAGTLLLGLLVNLLDLLELLDGFFQSLSSRGFSFGLFNPVYKPLFL